jgi:hypothetical protein
MICRLVIYLVKNIDIFLEFMSYDCVNFCDSLLYCARALPYSKRLYCGESLKQMSRRRNVKGSAHTQTRVQWVTVLLLIAVWRVPLSLERQVCKPQEVPQCMCREHARDLIWTTPEQNAGTSLSSGERRTSCSCWSINTRIFFLYISFSRTPAANRARDVFERCWRASCLIFGRAAVEKRAQPEVRSRAALHEWRVKQSRDNFQSD